MQDMKGWYAKMQERIDRLEKCMIQQAKVESARLAAYQDLDDRLDVLEATTDWSVWKHLHRMWRHAESRLDKLEAQGKGAAQLAESYLNLHGRTEALEAKTNNLTGRLKALGASHTHEANTTAQERDALAQRIAEMEHANAMTQTEFRLAAQERHYLAVRLGTHAETLLKMAETIGREGMV